LPAATATAPLAASGTCVSGMCSASWPCIKGPCGQISRNLHCRLRGLRANPSLKRRPTTAGRLAGRAGTSYHRPCRPGALPPRSA
jgi:hypothetical protein